MKANCFLSYFLLTLCIGAIAQPKNLRVKGLSDQVEVIRDIYGVNHIYAPMSTIYFSLKVIVVRKIDCFSLSCGEGKRLALWLKFLERAK
jgi:hypothetical protein